MSSRTEQLAVAVAPLLTGAWRFNCKASESDGWADRLTISDDSEPGRVILFAPFSKSGEKRIEIYGRLPKYVYGSFSTDHMTVSESRSPLAIAHDINRRLIPDYLKKWDEQKAAINRHQREAAEHLQKIELVRRAVVKLRGEYGREITSNESNFTFKGGSLRMHPGGGIEPELKLQLDYSDVLQVLHFVKKMKADKS